MPDDLPITERLIIPSADLKYEFSRSGGPGGQHANTSDTRVRLRFDLQGCSVLYASVKRRIREAEPNRLTSDGELLIEAERHRSRHQNVEDARARLVAIVRANLKPPKPRRATKPSRRSQKRRMDKKSERGKTKKLRGKVKWD